MTDRADYILGLRALADLLEAHDALPLPSVTRIDMWLSSSTKDALVAAARLFPGRKEKVGGDGWFALRAQLHGLTVDLNTSREAVCERVVTPREVEVEVNACPACFAPLSKAEDGGEFCDAGHYKTVALPTVTVARTEDIVEWVCEPLLADREQDPPDGDPQPFDMSGATAGAER